VSGQHPQEPPANERFADTAHRYRLESRIATGGMGEVWRATDTRLGRPVAVKVLKPEYADDAAFRQRFAAEAQHAAALHHPGVASVYDFGEAPPEDSGDDSPRPYLVMELVDGKPLSELIRPGQPLDPEVTRDLIAQAADAVAVAHRAGIVHRDLKPANLLITPDRRVKVTDFGIARAGEGMALTQTGQVMGTPQYLSPEQARGAVATQASDIYSLGVVAFECLTASRPFNADNPVATALAHLREPVPQLPDSVPPGLAATVTRALAKEPGERFVDADAFAAALRTDDLPPLPVAPPPATTTQVLPATTVLPPETKSAAAVATPVPPLTRRTKMPPWPWLLFAAVVLIGLIALVAALSAGNDPSNSPSVPTSSKTKPASPTTTASSPPAPTSSVDDTVQVNEGDYVGEDVHQAESELKALGLTVSTSELSNDGTQQENTVESVDPNGTLHKSDEVTISYWGKPELPKPTPPGHTKKPHGHEQKGQR
jgi:serine/threonine-protein kinase